MRKLVKRVLDEVVAWSRSIEYLLAPAGGTCPGPAGVTEGDPFEVPALLKTLPAFLIYFTKPCGLSPRPPPAPPCAEELIAYDSSILSYEKY